MINRAKVEVGSSCVCVGCGGVGLNVIQSCRLAGATQIVAVDMEPSKVCSSSNLHVLKYEIKYFSIYSVNIQCEGFRYTVFADFGTLELSKLEAAKLFGATHVVNAREVKDVAKAVKKLTGGGADYGFESVGRPETYVVKWVV